MSVVKLAQEAAHENLIPTLVCDQLSSLHPQVPNSMRYRYLLACLKANSMPPKVQKYIEVHPELQKYAEVHSDDDDDDDNDISLGSEHLADLTELLVDYAHKWRAIGIALRFLPQYLDKVQASPLLISDAPNSYMSRILGDWLDNKCENASPPTKNNLKEVLRRKSVGLANKVQEVNFVFCAHSSKPSFLRICVSKFANFNEEVSDIEYSVFVDERVYTLVEVCPTLSDCRSCSYHWEIYGLSDNSKAYYTCHNFLCVRIEDLGSRRFMCRIEDTSRPPLRSPPLDELDTSEWGIAVIDVTPRPYYAQVVVNIHVKSVLDQFRKSLALTYLNQSKIPKDTWPPVRNRKFINLALIKQNTLSYNSVFAQSTIRGDMDDILLDKDKIEYDEVYSSLKGGQLVVIEGRPGCGKTTFVHKIAHDWATQSGELNGHLRLVLLVSIRVLNTINNPDLSDILKQFGDLKVSQHLIEMHNGKGVCFIFDGFDEFSSTYGERSIVHRIINKTYLSQSTVIVASRPAAVADLRQEKASFVLEVLGFFSDQIFEYVGSYPFCDPLKGELLNSYLLSHPEVLYLCYLPIHASMIAYLFEHTGEVPKTEMEIYYHFTRSTLIRNLTKDGTTKPHGIDMKSLKGDDKKHFEQICQLAFEKTLRKKQVLNQDEVSSFFLSDDDRDFSLDLITIDRTAVLYDILDVYTFVHLTFQEYLAAYHISTLSAEEQRKLVLQHGHQQHMLVTLKFFCGFKPDDTIVSLFLEKTVQDSLFRIQCVYMNQQQSLSLQLLQVMDNHILIQGKNLNISDFTAIGFVTSAASLPFELSFIHCNINIETVDAFLSETFNVTKHLIQGLRVVIDSMDEKCTNKLLANCLEFLDHFSIESEKTGICYFSHTKLCIINMDTDSLAVDFNKLSYAGLTKVVLRRCVQNRSTKIMDIVAGLHHCQYLKELDLSGIVLDTPQIEAVFVFLKSCRTIQKFFTGDLPDAKVLEFFNCLVEMQGFNELVEPSSNVRLSYDTENLASLSYCRSEDNKELEVVFLLHSEYILTNLNAISKTMQKCSKLTELKFSHGICNADGAEILLSALSHCPSLQILDLSCNSIGTREIEIFFGKLNNFANLRELDLSNNKIHLSGVEVLSSCLVNLPHLQKLSLANNLIFPNSCRSLAASLHHCTELQFLDLQCNCIDNAGVNAIVLSLGHCKQFKALNLPFTGVSPHISAKCHFQITHNI